MCVTDGVTKMVWKMVVDKDVCDKDGLWKIVVDKEEERVEEERAEEREAEREGYRIKNKNPTQWCGEKTSQVGHMVDDCDLKWPHIATN